MPTITLTQADQLLVKKALAAVNKPAVPIAAKKSRKGAKKATTKRTTAKKTTKKSKGKKK